MKTIQLTDEQIQALGGTKVEAVDGTFFEIGKAYLIRCVTNFWTGRLIGVTETELLLEDAAWIADTGRFHDAATKGELSEVEPVGGRAIIGRGAIVDAIEWTRSLPLEQK